MIVKVQLPIFSTDGTAGVLVYNKDQSVMAELPEIKGLRKKMKYHSNPLNPNSTFNREPNISTPDVREKEWKPDNQAHLSYHDETEMVNISVSGTEPVESIFSKKRTTSKQHVNNELNTGKHLTCSKSCQVSWQDYGTEKKLKEDFIKWETDTVRRCSQNLQRSDLLLGTKLIQPTPKVKKERVKLSQEKGASFIMGKQPVYNPDTQTYEIHI